MMLSPGLTKASVILNVIVLVALITLASIVMRQRNEAQHQADFAKEMVLKAQEELELAIAESEKHSVRAKVASQQALEAKKYSEYEVDELTQLIGILEERLDSLRRAESGK